jgi:hypothetical protein
MIWLILPKTADVLKLKPYWCKMILKAASAAMKAFLKAANRHMNGFLKAVANSIKKSAKY